MKWTVNTEIIIVITLALWCTFNIGTSILKNMRYGEECSACNGMGCMVREFAVNER